MHHRVLQPASDLQPDGRAQINFVSVGGEGRRWTAWGPRATRRRDECDKDVTKYDRTAILELYKRAPGANASGDCTHYAVRGD